MIDIPLVRDYELMVSELSDFLISKEENAMASTPFEFIDKDEQPHQLFAIVLTETAYNDMMDSDRVIVVPPELNLN